MPAVAGPPRLRYKHELLVPNRLIRDGILTSDRVNTLTLGGEVFYRRLLSVVDDYGRFDGRHVMLKVSCYPLRVDSVREADISRWIAECEKAGLIVLYAVDGKPYLAVLDFRQQVRAKHSKFPPPPDDAHLHSTRVAGAHLDGDGEGDGDDSPPKRAARTRKKATTPLPDGFGISERVQAWAKEKGHTRLAERLEHFIGKVRAKGYTYLDWDEAFMGAIRDDWARLSAQSPQKSDTSDSDYWSRFGNAAD